MIKLIKNTIENIKFHCKKILELKTSSKSIALGFSIGTFIALLPTFGFGAIIGLFLLLIFRNINKVSLLSSFVIWNPLVLAPFYFLSYNLGALIYNTSETINVGLKFTDLIYIYSETFLIGNIILSLFVSILSYFLIRFIVDKFYRGKYIS